VLLFTEKIEETLPDFVGCHGAAGAQIAKETPKVQEDSADKEMSFGTDVPALVRRRAAQPRRVGDPEQHKP
jgi:hypothetical protein